MSTPSAPVEVGFVDTPGRALSGVSVAAGFAYLGDGSGGLRVIDVSTPSTPVEVSFLESPGAADAIAVQGGYAYVGFHDASDAPGTLQTGVRVFDVTDPSAPLEIGFVDTPGEATDIATSGGYAYVADSGGGLRVMDVSIPSAPVELASVDTSGPARGVAIARGHAYVAASGSGLRIIDVSAPSAPVEVGFVEPSATS